MSELKPCPFCGGEAKHEPELRLVYCTQCDAEGPGLGDVITLWNAAPRPEPSRTCATCDAYEQDNPCMIFAGGREKCKVNPDTFYCAEWRPVFVEDEPRPAGGQAVTDGR